MLYQKKNSEGVHYFECIRYSNFNILTHMHRHPELLFVRKGRIVLESGSGRELIVENEFGFIMPNEMHSYKTESDSLVDICIFSADYVPVFFNQTRGKKADRTKFVCRESGVRYVKDELFTDNGTPDFYTLKSALYAVLGEFLSQAELADQGKGELSAVDSVVAYVAENFEENITLKAIASELEYEFHYLSKAFRKRIPMNFSRYVNLYRVENATYLLHNTELPITEIALKCGFQSIRNFNRAYLSITGNTPSRDKQREAKASPCAELTDQRVKTTER